MAGKIVISTLNNDTGVLATQNGMTGIAKAWVQFVGSSGSINASFNVSSVTRNGTGDYTINFTTAMANANYSLIGTCTSNSGISDIPAGIVTIKYGSTPTTSACQIWTGDSRNGNKNDMNWVNISVSGS
jgi:hypothetical protein